MPPTPRYLGEFENAVLLAVAQLGDEAYAVPMRAFIEDRTGRAVARGALYTALERLESQGLPGLPDGRPHGGAWRTGPGVLHGLRGRPARISRSTHTSLTRLSEGIESLLEQP